MDNIEEDMINEAKDDQPNLVYKLQILYGTNLQGADISVFSRTPNTSDPYVVVTYCANELARSAITPQSTTPLFRSVQGSSSTRGVFCVDVPNEVAFANAGRAKAPELVVQVYDHDNIGVGNFLGETRLRALDLRSAVGRRIVKSLKPMQRESTDHNIDKFVGGEMHMAGHLVSGQPHFMVHILEAHNLPAKCVGNLAPLPSNNLAHKFGTHSLAKKGNSVTVSPFVICYWDEKEVGRTDVQHRTECPRWGGDPENVFRASLSLSDEIQNQRVWRSQYCPVLRFELYDAVQHAGKTCIVLVSVSIFPLFGLCRTSRGHPFIDFDQQILTLLV